MKKRAMKLAALSLMATLAVGGYSLSANAKEVSPARFSSLLVSVQKNKELDEKIQSYLNSLGEKKFAIETKEDKKEEKEAKEKKEEVAAPVIVEEVAPVVEEVVQPSPVVPVSPYQNIALARVNGSYVNIRKEPSLDSEIIGKLYDNSAGTILDDLGNGWLLVTSGSVKGYIDGSFVLRGGDIDSIATEVGNTKATVNVVTLNVRAQASADSDIVTMLGQGTEYTVLEDAGEWVKIAYEGGQGFISKAYISLDTTFNQALSIEEEQAIIAERERKAAEEAEAARIAAAAAAAEAAAQAVAEAPVETPVVEEVAPVVEEAPAPVEETVVAPVVETPAQPQPVVEEVAPVVEEAPAPAPIVAPSANASIGQQMADLGVQYINHRVPYVWGGANLATGVDCSGFVQQLHANFGISIPRVTYGQLAGGTRVSLDALQPGDLVFFTGTSHVGMYIGGNQYVHSSQPGTDVIISTLYQGYWSTPEAAVRYY